MVLLRKVEWKGVEEAQLVKESFKPLGSSVGGNSFVALAREFTFTLICHVTVDSSVNGSCFARGSLCS
jgi:hypothetical protein